MKTKTTLLFCIALIWSCQNNKTNNYCLAKNINHLEHIKGKAQNKAYLYVTAGSKLYSIGNQEGNFPEVGFHLSKEMGGVWCQPIKLLDGFRVELTNKLNQETTKLNNATQFIAYPLASQFEYDLQKQGLKITRTDFVPDKSLSMGVEYLLTNTSNKNQKIDFKLKIDSDLRPTWLSERINIKDTKDQLVLFDSKEQRLILRDSLNDWFAGIQFEGYSKVLFNGKEKSPFKGNGITASMTKSLIIKPNETEIVRFYIVGSIKNTQEIGAFLTETENDFKSLVAQKIERYKSIDDLASIQTPDKTLNQAYRWGKYNIDWLVRDVDDLGRGLSAGLPDYPWFFSNDQSSAFAAIVGTIEPDIFESSWKMIKTASDKVNNNSGQIIHEMSSNGVVYDKGRMEESQSFINAVWEIYKWTGNKVFLKTYYEQGKKISTFLEQHDKNKNLYVEGNGGVEIDGLNDEMLDVAAQTQVFFETMSAMAHEFNDTKTETDFKEKAKILKQNINTDWWIPSEKRYGDFIANKEKTLQLIDVALKKRTSKNRNQWAIIKLNALKEKIKNNQYKNKSYCVFYNASNLTPLTLGIADVEKGKELLKNIDFFTNKFGLYIAGISRPDNILIEENSVAYRSKNNFNYDQAVMPAGTSAIILAQCKYGLPDDALKYIHKLLNTYSFATPGTTYEISPDYGMFVQAWNVEGINVPLIKYFFGVNPFAAQKTIEISPNLPTQWKKAQLKNLLIGNNKISIDFKKLEKTETYVIQSTKENWTLNFNFPKNAKNITLNGKSIKNISVALKGKINEISYLKN